MSHTKVIEQVIANMGMVVLLQRKPMDYVLLGTIPEFYLQIFSHNGKDASQRPWEFSKTFAYFMEDVEYFFNSSDLEPIQESDNNIQSNIWTETGYDGKEYTLFAIGEIQGENKVIIIRWLDSNFIKRIEILQAAKQELLKTNVNYLEIETLPRNVKKDAVFKSYTNAQLYALVHGLIHSHKVNKLFLSLLFVELVNLEEINERIGHYAGDITLLRIHTALQNQLREEDILIRYGSSTFAILTISPSATNTQLLADKLFAIVNSHYFKDMGEVKVAIGFSHFEESDNTQTFITKAEQHLTHMKEIGVVNLKGK
ncbi:GGDEF domain-containing protein [Desulfovibrio litoralis]|uniref:diguanylate cyclase n=1 Tax=Desulfovibrio litoralis DSM 11393 TaxID=1121455 RepID=A0A1M7RXE7_9BACT|nr:GGDEF domain-containing protein [Desulfovibrio litoralis]SHN50979.1 diguanylate cyclase (GGDEF) domain-containing protein [Desulfovibrio litoralis DSM 11393]